MHALSREHITHTSHTLTQRLAAFHLLHYPLTTKEIIRIMDLLDSFLTGAGQPPNVILSHSGGMLSASPLGVCVCACMFGGGGGAAQVCVHARKCVCMYSMCMCVILGP